MDIGYSAPVIGLALFTITGSIGQMHVPLPLMDYSPAMTGTAIVTGASRAAGELPARKIRFSRGIMLECADRLGPIYHHGTPQPHV